jgi:hypothetical protein
MKTFLFSPDDGSGAGGGSTTILGGDAGASTQSAVTTTAAAATTTTATTGGEWDFRSALDDKGAFKQGWVDTLPPDLKDYAGTLGKYPNVAELLRGHGNAQKLIGQRVAPGVKVPGPDAKPEEIAAYRKAIGVPDDVTGYGLKKPDALPEGVEWNEEEVGKFGALAHELGLTPAQAQKLVAFDTERMGKMNAGGKAKLDAFIAGERDALKKEWGENYQNNVGKALKAAELLGLDVNDAEIGNSAKMIKALHSAASLIQEDKFVASNKVGLGLTGADQAEDIRRNPANPWHAAYHNKEGKERQQQAQSLMMRLQGVKDPIL